ncbi:MAG: hypothetical protein MZV49_01140 [Rhodopseudomonas palustris]|nr:hypothetical protein [Rhodopseudomonas palustris]
MLQVEGLGDAVGQRQMLWYHLPIVDVSTPDQAFEDAWHDAGESLRAVLRSDVVVHCRGGLGHAGTAAARLLIELGAEPLERGQAGAQGAAGRHRNAEPEEACADACGAVPERQPAARGGARSALGGALLGLAVGDALGMPLEFLARDTYPPLQDMIGGGRHGL